MWPKWFASHVGLKAQKLSQQRNLGTYPLTRLKPLTPMVQATCLLVHSCMPYHAVIRLTKQPTLAIMQPPPWSVNMAIA